MKKSQDSKQTKMSKNDRFAQMTQQERLIQEKKREIQNKLEARRRQNLEESKREKAQQAHQQPKPQAGAEPGSSSSTPNIFSNDGSFLQQFKQLKEKKPDSKSKSLNKYSDKNRWSKSSLQSSANVKPLRFSLEKQQITITTKTTFPSENQANSETVREEKVVKNVVVSRAVTKTTPNQQIVTPPPPQQQQLNFQQPNTTRFQNTNLSNPPPQQQQQQMTFNPPPSVQFSANQSPFTSTSQNQLQHTQPQIIQQFNTLPPQLNQIQQPIQVLNTQNQEIAVQQQLVAPQTQLINLQSGSVQQVQLQAIPGTEGSLSLIQQPLGNQQVLLNVPPPQLVQTQLTNIVLTSQAPSVLVSAPSTVQLTTVALPPPVLTGQTVELASIPPPNPIQVQNIPQPEPLNTINIPPPAPLQVQNIPTPTTLHINQIPDPKPLDLMAIPTPNSRHDFIKNIPPPNKNVPPPTSGMQFHASLPPQEVLIHTIAPTNQIQHSPAPLQPPNLQLQSTTQQTILTQVPNSMQIPNPVQVPASMMQGPVPPPSMIQAPNHPPNSMMQAPNPIPPPSSLQTPPPMLPNQVSSLPPTPLPQGQPPNFQNRPGSAPPGSIPSLMSQRVLPPSGMKLSIPPPPINRQAPPPNFEQFDGPKTRAPPPVNVNVRPQPDLNAVFPPGTKDYEAMASLARMVVDCGPSIEHIVKEKKNRDPDLWFLFHKDSAAYSQYLDLIEHYKRKKDETRYDDEEEREERYDREREREWHEDRPNRLLESEIKVENRNDEPYEPEMALQDDDDSFEIKPEIKQETEESQLEARNERKRKKRSRWGEKAPNVQPPGVVPVVIPTLSHMPPIQPSPMLSKMTRADPGLMQYVMMNYGSTNLEEDTWKKAEENYKIHLLYQDMMKKRAELERLAAQGKNKYEYDSDEDTDGGTWEHKLRQKEMQATERWSVELNKQAEGKHHIGDFLPPEELKRFMENCNAVKEGRQPNFSDYKEFKIKEDNIGFKMLQKLGWSEGQGLGQNSAGIVEPVNKGAPREHTQGLGLHSELATEGEDEYETYRKRMMLAYRFRPNPLNNPRRPYY